MARHTFLAVAAIATLVLTGCAGSGPSLDELKDKAGSVLGGSGGGPLSDSDIAAGLKEALQTGSNAVVAQLGVKDGFNADPAIRVPLPRSLQKARDLAGKVGLASSFDDLELRLNRAAEAATPKAKALFIGAIKSMSLDDARGILQGPDDAATTFFRERTGADLRQQMRPLIDNALAEVGAVSTFNNLLERYNRIPLAPPVEADLTGHVVDEASQGIFYYLAREEQAIRENPVKRTSELLRRVFGSES